MLQRGLLIFTALGLAIVNSPSARADMCFRYTTTFGGTYVMKGVTLPNANSCIPLAMYEASNAPEAGFGGAATGSLCLATDGSTVVFQYTYDGCTGDYFESGICRLQLNGDGDPLPTTSSSCRLTLSGGIFYHYVNDAQIYSCDSSQLLLPGGGGAQCIPAATRQPPQ